MKTRITPSKMTNCLINLGYNKELSAPFIANTYLRHKELNEPLPKNWEKETIKDAQTCYNKIKEGGVK